jgi:peptide/nickel transport system permease protein
MAWARYLARRLALALLLVLALSVANFALIHLAPGDPAEVMAGAAGAATPEILDDLRREFGLHLSFGRQLALYVGHVLQGDLGTSYSFRQPVLKLLLARVPATLLLMLTAVAASAIAGITLGVIAAVFSRSWIGSVISVLSIVAHATPLFWVGLMLIIVFVVHLDWFPAHGMETVATGATGLAYARDVLHHLVLPATTLGLFYMTLYARLTRASMLEVLRQDYIVVARAKGLSEAVVHARHALRNAVLPVVTIAGIQMGNVLGGSVVVESVFAWPGLGRLLFEAVLQRDYPLLLGGLLFTATLVIVSNILTDASYRLVDPRIRAA